ncbi:diguanylate cyclase domain-containing protein [Nibricoccus sp. IMCC34717]|uniref:GGDEF domain-containing response regulator n=1 Tax=Nibricoccus sp. IMCC34717 TaxID=3034021 RepID=UPI00384D5B28
MLYHTIKVLLVEDMVMIAKITEQMLKKAPDNRYSVVHKTRIADSVEALKAEDFDVVLLDLNLPDSRELDTLNRVVEVAPEVPIIVLTATNSDAMGLKAVQMGAQDFLLKGDFNYLTLDRAIVYAIERHRLQRTIRQLAVLDELTGLYNRRGFNTLHLDVLARIKGSDAQGFLCYFDLDRFKKINDELGHAIGDEALKEFASTLRTVFRKDALLIRLGGDEFVSMGIEHHPGEVEQILQSLEVLLSVRNTQAGVLFSLESSAGVTYFDRHNTLNIDELGRQADAALYEHKERRRRSRHPLDPAHQEDRR